jgi:hypothetical protein
MTTAENPAADGAVTKPSFWTQIRLLLPDHTFIEHSFGRTDATWTTPTGVWHLRLESPILGARRVTIRDRRGANVIGIDRPTMEQLAGHLRLIGAVADEGALFIAAEETLKPLPLEGKPA